MQNGRYKFLDVAKGIAIILMVFGHCTEWNKIYNYIYLFHMATFIFISGYLFKNRCFSNLKELTDYLKARIKKLYLFYLKYEMLFFLLTNIFLYVGFYSSTIKYGDIIVQPLNSISNILKQVLLIIMGAGKVPFGGMLWFIISLIFITLGYSVIRYISNKQKIINPKVCEKIIIVICFIIGCVKYDFIPTKINSACTLMLIYDLGNEAYIHRSKIKFNNYILTIIAFISLIILNNYGFIRMVENRFSNPIYFVVCSILGIYLVLSIANLITNKWVYLSNKLEYLGQITLLIMAWHLLAFKIAMIIQFTFEKINFKNLAYLYGYHTNNLWIILYMICGIGLPIVIDKITKSIKNKMRKEVI